MSDISLSLTDIAKLREFSKWKKENPEEYKQFWIDVKEIYKDLIKAAKEIAEEVE